MPRRETFLAVPLPDLPLWKENCKALWHAQGLKSKARTFKEISELPPQDTIFAHGTSWSNKDLDPVPPEQRTWRNWDFITYWCSDQFTIATWSFGAILVGQGFTFREIIPITFCGFLLTGIVVALCGHIATNYHIGFPLSTRMSWGMRGGAFPVLIRAFMALMWLAILNLSIAQCIHQMLRAIWPEFDNLPNHLPASAGITSADLLCYFILLIVQTPLTLIPMYKLKWYFLLKAILSPMVFIGMMIWALKNVPDGGPLVTHGATLEGSRWDQDWTRVKAFGTAAGYFATITTNIPDFVRFARRPGNTWVQTLALPCTGILPVICAVITCSATIKMWDEAYWQPAEILAHWDNRGAVFIAAVVWIIATIGVNLSANTITVAIALSSFWPRYINNIRGSLIVAVLSVIICPWKIVYSAGSFYNFLGAYPSLLGPVSGILMADYWLVRKRSLDVRHLYVLRGGKFWFWHGINWRAYAAFLCAYIPNIPGFVSEVNPSIKNVQPYTYDLNWIFAVIVSVLTFWALNLIFPPTYSLSGEAVHPDEVVDWSTRTRVGDWSGVPGFEDEEIQGEEVLNYTKGTEALGGNMHNVMDGPQKADSEASLEKTV